MECHSAGKYLREFAKASLLSESVRTCGRLGACGTDGSIGFGEGKSDGTPSEISSAKDMLPTKPPAYGYPDVFDDYRRFSNQGFNLALDIITFIPLYRVDVNTHVQSSNVSCRVG